MLRTYRHNTAIGTVFSSWSDKGLFSLALGEDASRLPANSDALDPALVNAFDEQLVAYATDGQATFRDVAVDPTGWTPFSRRVYQCCRQIAPGETMTYKQLAAAAGNEKASRAVGAAMAKNRILLVIPCHRVLASNGQLRGFSAPGGLVTKQSLLDLELAPKIVQQREPSPSGC
jgi:methylated-DNA-[protein]-cysteine S-methyltransferase